jgi:Flp pilus assembly pilin Flp
MPHTMSLDIGAAWSLSRPRGKGVNRQEEPVTNYLRRLWSDEQGQDIAEYAVMLAVILVIVVGTVRLIGGNANSVFSSVGSAIQ